MASKTKSGGGRKHGRGLRSPAHKKYVLTNRRAVNKIARISKHIRGLEIKILRFIDRDVKDPSGMKAEVKRAKLALKRVK